MIDPFLKWPGGKRWLAASDRLPLPRQFNRYLEPFLGGGAVFFHLLPGSAILSDINPELIELYSVVRDDPGGLQCALAEHQVLHCKAHYYSMRTKAAQTVLERAARTLYLNRTCWNGLYRVNLDGQFNVPIGTKTSVIAQGENFLEASTALQSVNLRCADFEETIQQAEEGDLVFVDPPYTVQHNSNGFVKYNERLFSWADQIRLRDAIEAAIRRGAYILATNADHDSVRELYAGICDYTQLDRTSVLSGVASKRGRTTEALFSANLPAVSYVSRPNMGRSTARARMSTGCA
jgi:DNA adenine methylase